MISDAVSEVSELRKYDLEEDNLKTMLEAMPVYSSVKEEGRLCDEEMPDQIGRKGESGLSFAYNDFQYHFEGMLDRESFANISDDEGEAAGALFGASYALFRNKIMEEGYPAENASFEQDIGSQEERKRFLEEGAVELRGEVMGPWGYDHEKMNEVMDASVALEAYNDVAEEIL